MNKLPKIVGLSLALILYFSTALSVKAVTLVQQTNDYSSATLSVWQVLQELGNNLSGTADKFTFRVHTSQPNANQFDHTAINTRLYDKTTNTYIIACVASDSNPADKLRGLTFTTEGVPSGYEDVTMDFSCNKYEFTTGHNYLIFISNANAAAFGGMRMQLATTAYGSSATDYFSAGGVRYTFDNGTCYPQYYVLNSQTASYGCNIWTNPKDDLYFTLSNNSPNPKTAVIFIPGIGGSEFKTSQDIVWSQSDGHEGTYSHAYPANEKVWVNQDEAIKLGNDDYFDILRLKSDGQTPEASLSLTGNLTSYGYGDIDSFFEGMGYSKNTNYFVFPYDWRKDVRNTQSDLDSLIETAKTKTGLSKVNLVVHSLGGLVARNYIADSTRAGKVNKLIELGVPHLGTPLALKTLMYGIALGRPLIGNFYIGLAASESRDIYQNLPSGFQLLPTKKFYDFYNNSSTDYPYPFRDEWDIDKNGITGSLTYDQTKSLLQNLSYNMTVFESGEQYHNSLDSLLNQANGVKIYEIVGTAQPTLGQIRETWWITWPINLIPKQDEIFINGDDTVPLYSASLKDASQDISGATKIYYVEQRHSDLVSSNGTAMQTVRSILNEDNSSPVDVKDQKIGLDGQQISINGDTDLDLYDDVGNHTGLDSNGEVETNLSDTFYDSIGKSKHIFVKKKAKKYKAKVTTKKSTKTQIRIRHYSQDSINKTTAYNDVPVSTTTPVELAVDPMDDKYSDITVGGQTITPIEATGSASLDQIAPVTNIQISGTKDSNGIYTTAVTITLSGSDTGSGIYKIEYSLDNGTTIQTYTQPFTLSTSGKYTILIKSTDNLGNEEIPQTINLEIAIPTASTKTTTTTTSSSGNSSDANTGSSSESQSETSTSSNTSVSQSSERGSSNPATLADLQPQKPESAQVLGIQATKEQNGELMTNLNSSENEVTRSFIQLDPFLSGLLIVTVASLSMLAPTLISVFIPWSNSLLRGNLPLPKPRPK